MKKLPADRALSPRLSEVTGILPLIRGHLIAAAPERPLTTAMEVSLLPVCEDGLLGYELVPDREAHTYLILGCNVQGQPVLRKTTYGVGRAGTVELVAVNGHLLSRADRAARYSAQPRDYRLPDWTAAAESALTQLSVLFQDRPLLTFASSDKVLGLEHALSIAYSRLIRWDPIIQVFGLPNEAELGFALAGTNGEAGALAFRPPDLWTLHWNAPPDVIHESWSLDANSAGCVVRGCDTPDRRRRNRRASDRSTA